MSHGSIPPYVLGRGSNGQVAEGSQPRSRGPAQPTAGSRVVELVAEELHHLVREPGPERGRVEAQEPAVHALLGPVPESHSTASSAHGRPARTRGSGRRTSAAAPARPLAGGREERRGGA